MTDDTFLPTANWNMLRRRAALLQQIRGFFITREFLEVETPLLSRESVIDQHLDPLSVVLFNDAQHPELGPRYWLQTSPEFGMKRLLAAGAPSIFQICKAFRGGEVGPLHNPEFTMLEWYAVGQNYAAGMQFLSDLVQQLLGGAPAERITYRQAFQRYAQVDPFTISTTALRACVPEAPVDWDRELLLDVLLTRRVQPELGKTSPVILHDYPANQAALAQVRQEPFPVAERYELYYQGVELANGYHELTDANILAQRNAVNQQARLSEGKPPLPETTLLLAAMQAGLPSCAGCAMGLDRLLMLATGARQIAEVIPFTSDRA